MAILLKLKSGGKKKHTRERNKNVRIFWEIINFTAILCISCSSDDYLTNINDDAVNIIDITQKTEFEIDTLFVAQEANSAMVSFVNAVKENYTENMTFEELKDALDPENQLSSITDEGNILLLEAYDYIVEDVQNEEMSGVNLLLALYAIIEHSEEQGAIYLSEIDLEIGSQWLFGLSDSKSLALKSGGCKWYQIGCHLNSFWNWFTSTGPGGGISNGQGLALLFGIIVAIVAFL